MTETLCIYPDRESACSSPISTTTSMSPRTSLAFETHLATCRCRAEANWRRFAASARRSRNGRRLSPPRAFSVTSPRAPSRRAAAWWHDVPVWAQVAAALLVLGVSASIANLDVRYDRVRPDVRTGWSKPRPGLRRLAPVNAAPWRADLTALENQLRSELQRAARRDGRCCRRRRPRCLTPNSAGACACCSTKAKGNSRTNWRLRLVQLQKDINAQHQADLTKISQNIGFIQRRNDGRAAQAA